jgi:scyllo-inositol 2-dehydrogenase (NADP+)
MTIRVGVIGYGLGGKCFHAPFVEPAGMRLVAVATSRAAEVAERHASAEAIADPAALIAREDIDLVAISTPTDTHAPLARAALMAGKHVVVDKPFTATPEEADDLIALAAARGRVLTVLQNRRWDADFLTLQALVAAGELGDLRHVQIRFDRWRPEAKIGWRNEIRPGSGLLMDLGAHLVDQAIRLSGKPDWVFADTTAQGRGARADDGFAMILAAGDTRIHLGSTPFALATAPRLVVHGTRGSFVKDGLDVQEAQLRDGIAPDAPGFGIEPAIRHGLLATAAGERLVPSKPGRYLDFWLGLARAVEGGVPPPVDPRDSALGLRVLAAAQTSRETGRRVAVA